MDSTITKFAFIILMIASLSCGTKQKESADESITQKPTVTEESTSETTDQYVYFIQPKDQDVVTSPVFVEMGVSGMEVEPKGPINPNKGHHHIIVNGSLVEEGAIIPANETNIHYGGGQTDAQLELDPGDYTLTLQFGDGVHASYGDKMSATIKITVQ